MRRHNLPDDLLEGIEVRSATPVSGGDISAAYRLDTSDGPLFAKTHDRPKPDMFEREAAGLAALREHAPDSLGVPEIVRATSQGLVLEWIDEGHRRSPATEAELGGGLAGLHRTTNDSFGGLDGSLAGYLGSAEIDLTPTTDWVEFFVERRVRPLVERAIEMSRVDSAALDTFERLVPHAAELCGPSEPPALVHGDLWAGNRLTDTSGRNWLIDPAAHWAHREYDLAMMRLFGGFGAECFAAYDEAFPLADGWGERVPWYQLPPLLVHAILFGGGYGASAMRVLRSYG